MNDIRMMIVIVIVKNKQYHNELLKRTLNITNTCNRFSFYPTKWFDNHYEKQHYYDTIKPFRVKRITNYSWAISL